MNLSLQNIEKNKQVTIATLPEGARPGGGRIVVDISNSDGAVVRLFIQASGDVIVYNGHVAIYDGEGGIIEAKGAAYGTTNDRAADSSEILGIRRIN